MVGFESSALEFCLTFNFPICYMSICFYFQFFGGIKYGHSPTYKFFDILSIFSFRTLSKMLKQMELRKESFYDMET